MTAYKILLIFPILSASSQIRRSPFQDLYPYNASLIRLRDGYHIPGIAFGTGKPDDSEPEPTSTYHIFRAVEVGFRHIDTSAADGVEEVIGKGIAQVIKLRMVERNDLFITSKLPSTHHEQSKVVPALKESLKKLQLAYVDLYLIHHPVSIKQNGSADDIDYLETWKGMIEAKTLGLTRSIGVSNFNEEQISRILKTSKQFPVVNQIEVNPTLTQISLVEFCQKLDIVVMAYSPFGFLPENTNARRYLQSKKKTSILPKEDDPTLKNIASKYQKNVYQIVLRYLIDRGLIPIPRSTNTFHINENFQVLDFNLTKNEIKRINSFNKNKRTHPYKAWENYPHYPFQINFIKRSWQPIKETSIYIPKENLTRRWEPVRDIVEIEKHRWEPIRKSEDAEDESEQEHTEEYTFPF